MKQRLRLQIWLTKTNPKFVFWNCNNHNIEGGYTINRINSEGEKFLLIDLELYYNNMMITCVSQHNKTLRILQVKLLTTGLSSKGWQSEY